jgi:hypothetical protein
MISKSIRKKARLDYIGTHYQLNDVGELILIPRYKIDKSFPKTVPIMKYIPSWNIKNDIKSLRKQVKLS